MFDTKTYLEEIASLYGVKSLFVLSIDDKAKVPMVTAEKQQAPIVVYVLNKVHLPDQDS